MGNLYNLITNVHNLVGSLTLLLTITAGAMLLWTARTTGGSGLVLRANLASASLQGLLGVVLVILGVTLGNGGYLAGLWLHFLLGIVTVALVSAMAGRARRAPDAEARRYGALLLALVVVVLITFLVGQFQYNPFA